MAKNILIATLGDHPAVITGMVKMLKYKKNIAVDEAAIFYTAGSGKLITVGYDLVEAALQDVCTITPCELPFADPVTRNDSIEFLRQLDGALKIYEDRGDTVYLSLAGGRKNMSALMAVICQFYPSVKGLFHLITKSDSSFPSIEALFDMTEGRRRAEMEPSGDEMTLVEIPHQTLSNAVELRRYFAAENRGEDYAVELSQAGEHFLRDVFQPARLTGMLNVYFSKTAYEQLQDFSGDRYKSFIKCFEQMKDPYALKERIHGTFLSDNNVFHFMKLCRTAERPFFFTYPNPVHLFPYKDKSIKQVIVCGLSVEKNNGGYYPDENYYLNLKDFSPNLRSDELNKNQTILLVPLGESPMVASQTYTLLQQSDRDWEKQTIAKVVVIYPEQNGPIKNGVNLLQKAFKRLKIDFQGVPIDGLRDVDSYETSQTYLNAIIKIVADLRRQNPDKQIAISLSGGRKGMSALTLFAAQGAGVTQVYHTAITDLDYEQAILQETAINKLELLSGNKLLQTLFLEQYDVDKFTLFEIPVIDFVQETTP